MPLTSVVRRPGLWLRFDPTAFPDADATLRDAAGEWGCHPDWVDVHASRGARVWRSRPGAAPAFFWKEFRARTAWDPLKSLLRGSRAARALRGGEALAALGLEAPRVLALAEERGFWGPSRSLLVTEAVELPALDRWAATGDLGARERRVIVANVGGAIARLHGGGLVHGDLRPSNVLCTRDARRIVFLDNERTRRSESHRERIRNLVQLGVDQTDRPFRTDRVRFVHAYARALGRSDEWARALVRELNAAIVARRARRRARGLDPLTGLRPTNPSPAS